QTVVYEKKPPSRRLFAVSAYTEISTRLVIDCDDEIHGNCADQGKHHVLPRDEEQRGQHDKDVEAELKPTGSDPIGVLQIERQYVDATDPGAMTEECQHTHPHQGTAHKRGEKRIDA